MKKFARELKESELPITLANFLTSFNQNMPASFPRVSVKLLEKFKAAHVTLFTQGDSWSLDRHRKKLIDWLPRHQEV